MFRQPSGSGSQSRAGLVGSGALSHVYLQYPPLRCSIPGAVGLHYDDGNKLLLAPTSNQVFAWQANQFTSVDIPNVVTINEGPVLSIRYSLDGKIIGVQRSQQEVEFINRETCTVFNQRCKLTSEEVEHEMSKSIEKTSIVGNEVIRYVDRHIQNMYAQGKEDRAWERIIWATAHYARAILELA
eukprot:Gb_13565 [translate_table: standard]